MTTPELRQRPLDRPSDQARLPWRTLLVLSTATLVMVTGEMLPTAVLVMMSTDLGVSESRAGLLVSVWALVVVVASFPLVRLTRTWDRTPLITISMLAFTLSAALTALAPTYEFALASRVLGAAAVGLLWSTVNAHVADLVPDQLLTRATAVVLAGGTLGLVLGTPLGRFAADLAGWRSAFWGLAVVGLVTTWLIPRVTPARRAGAGAVGATPTSQDRGRLGAMMTLGLLVALVLVGHFGAYTYVTVLGAGPASLLAGGVGTLLLLFGLSSAAGVALAARLGHRAPASLAAGSAVTAASVLALTLAQDHPMIGLGVVLVWGLASGTVAPLAQTLILRLAGPAHRATAGAMIPVLFNAGIAAGAALASVVVERHGLPALPVPAGALMTAAAVGLAVMAIARRPAPGSPRCGCAGSPRRSPGASPTS